MNTHLKVRQSRSIRRLAAVAAIASAVGVLATVQGASPARADGVLWSNWNTDGVVNGPTNWTAFSVSSAVKVSSVATYHWNNGRGATPGTISILDARTGNFIAGAYAQGQASGSYQNVNWIAPVSVTLQPGTYVVYDSDQSTWSQNTRSNGAGFAAVYGSTVSAPPPSPPPTNPPPTGGGFKPCMVNSGSWAALSPCTGRPGTVITIQLSRNIPSPLNQVVFRQDRNGAVCRSCGTVTVTGLSGGGTSAGSQYTLAAPRQLCMGGSGSRWHVFPIDRNRRGIGDIGLFMIDCR